MQLFYAPQINSGKLQLDKSDSGHCIKVLRKKPGDLLYLTDGLGTLYTAELTNSNPNKCAFQIIEQQAGYGKALHHLHIAIAPTKNIDRLEWFLEKAVEIGIGEISPIITFHSERKKINEDRLQKILISAMKQSLKTYLPKLNPLVKWKNFLKSPTAQESNYRGIAWMGEKSKQLFQDFPGGDALILIGPEGGFSEKEISEANAMGFHSISLGNSRLRTETAGLVACHSISLKNELNR